MATPTAYVPETQEPVTVPKQEAPKTEQGVEVRAQTPDVADPEANKGREHHELRHQAGLMIVNALVFIFGVIAISCLAAQIDGKWSYGNTQSTFALVVSIVGITLSGIYFLIRPLLRRCSHGPLKLFFAVEVFYHFAMMCLWFAAATVVAVFVTDQIDNFYNYNVQWNLYYAASEARAFVAFAYFASFAEIAGVGLALSAYKDN